MVCGMFGAELNVKKIVVPYTASVNCAFGLVSADIVHEYSTTTLLPVPSPAESINRIFEPMIARALRELKTEGFEGERVRLDWAVDMRYSRQVHEVTTQMRGRRPMDEPAAKQLVADFETLYERKFGKGSAYREAGMEMTQFRLTARGLMERPKLEPLPSGGADAGAARVGRRRIFVEARGGMEEADIYDFERLATGNVVSGPAVIHTPITTIVLQAGQRGTVDPFRNVIIEFS
jgi:N-methylhydantoinase A